MTASTSITQVSALATHTALSVWTLANNFLVVLVLLAAFFLFAWRFGRGPFVALMLSLYAGYAVYGVFPYLSLLPAAPAQTVFLAHVGVYAALSFAFFLILRRVIVSDFLYIGPFGLIALSFLGAGFLIALAAHAFSVTSVYQFTPQVAAYLVPAKYFFWWFVAPAVGLFIFAR